MTEQDTSESAAATPEPEAPIPFTQFLEAVHPSVERNVSSLWGAAFSDLYEAEMLTPDLRLDCLQCDGPRTFRYVNENEGAHRLRTRGLDRAARIFVRYLCGDCHEQTKTFALSITPAAQTSGLGTAYKYGEYPSFGTLVPNKVLGLFGDEKQNFLKGRQCENQGLGIGAFAYYRRIVEDHKNEIFDEIIKVCETVGASPQLIEEFRNAKKETRFTAAIEQIKTALPQGLLIGGHHNPLLALHNALSIGLHNESDAKCLETAHDVRLVLTDLVERMSLLRQDKRELDGAMQRLMAKNEGA